MVGAVGIEPLPREGSYLRRNLLTNATNAISCVIMKHIERVLRYDPSSFPSSFSHNAWSKRARSDAARNGTLNSSFHRTLNHHLDKFCARPGE
jgi:hypothetical protein